MRKLQRMSQFQLWTTYCQQLIKQEKKVHSVRESKETFDDKTFYECLSKGGCVNTKLTPWRLNNDDPKTRLTPWRLNNNDAKSSINSTPSFLKWSTNRGHCLCNPSLFFSCFDRIWSWILVSRSCLWFSFLQVSTWSPSTTNMPPKLAPGQKYSEGKMNIWWRSDLHS